MDQLFQLPSHYEGALGRRFKNLYIGALERYFNEHVEPGGFLRAVLENDLMFTHKRADEYARLSIVLLLDILIEAAPSKAWGSKEAVAAWLQDGERA